MANILIFGQNDLLSQKLCAPLMREKHCVMRCAEHEPLPEALLAQGKTVMIMDAQLKWSVCRPLLHQIRQKGYPVLFVTEDRQMVSHLRALYQGPCDVLTVPFSGKTLCGRVQSLLGTEPPMRELTVNEQERVALLDGERVELTAQELALLLALMENPDMPISREQLLRKAWGYQSMGDTRTVDVHVQRLRKKLGGERIETVYKCGYRLKMA